MEENKVTFESLYNLDVRDKVEQKNGLNYLSWAYAWAEIKRIYPNAKYNIYKFGENQLPYVYDEKTGYMVFTDVTIEDVAHEMWLPVMDGANKTMLDHVYTYQVKDKKNGGFVEKTVEPATMFDINKTIMRCLTKNLAMFGLGLSLYQGEDLPLVATVEDAENYVLTFGKYQGQTLKEVFEEDESYVTNYLYATTKDENIKKSIELLTEKEEVIDNKNNEPTPYDFEPMTEEQVYIIASLDPKLKEQLRKHYKKDIMTLTKKEAENSINSLKEKGLYKSVEEIKKEKKEKEEVF